MMVTLIKGLKLHFFNSGERVKDLRTLRLLKPFPYDADADDDIDAGGKVIVMMNGNSRKCHAQVPHFSMEKKSDCIGLPLGSKFHKIQVQKVASEM